MKVPFYKNIFDEIIQKRIGDDLPLSSQYKETTHKDDIKYDIIEYTQQRLIHLALEIMYNYIIQ